jgi:hypothetical protein
VSTQRAAFFDLDHAPRPTNARHLFQQAITTHRAAGDLLVFLVSPTTPHTPQADIIVHMDQWARIYNTHPQHPNHHGPAKSLAVVETMVRLRLNPSHSFGYGDPCDNSAFLDIVGNPRVIPCSPATAKQAHNHGWPIITSVLAP